MNFLNQYRGLRREIYVLVFGRIVTNMGATIWPMLTLILSNKLDMSAKEIATILLVMNVVRLPCALIGGKLADKYNKRNIIIVCDLVTVTSYIICSMIEISSTFIVLFFIAGLFGAMEWPSYDALLADLTKSQDRERAYSLNYLGANLGLVLAPIVGGMLFENYLNLSFLITALATLSSTILIFFLIKNISKETETSVGNHYEIGDDSSSLFKVLKDRKIIFYYTLCSGVSALVYSQFNFLIPLNLEMNYGAKGAVYFGILTSVNAFVVILFTPLFTTLFAKVSGVAKAIMGELLIAISFTLYIFGQQFLAVYFVSMVIFTFGEVLNTLGRQPYLTRRIPSSHRGRVSSFTSIFTTGFESISQRSVGKYVDILPITGVWGMISGLGFLSAFMYVILLKWDKKEYSLLYKDELATVESEK